MRAVLSRLVKVGFEAVVLAFAFYAFAFVPLGQHTALEHIRRIVATPPAQEAGQEAKAAFQRLVKRVSDGGLNAPERNATKPLTSAGTAILPPLAPGAPGPADAATVAVTPAEGELAPGNGSTATP